MIADGAQKQAWTASDLVKPKIGKVDVDDGFVYIRALSAAYSLELRGKELHGVEIFDIISKSVCDPDGVTLLTTEQVGEMAITTLEQITKGVFAFNALGQKAVADAVDELKKTDVLTTNSAHS